MLWRFVECEASSFSRVQRPLAEFTTRSIGSLSNSFFRCTDKAWVTRPARRCKTTTPIWLRCAAPAACRPLQPSLIGLFTDAPASIRAPTPVPHCAWQCIEELRGKREELNTSIATDEEEKGVGCL